MSTNGHHPDDMPQPEDQQQEHQDAVRAGIASVLALEQSSGLGYSFNALQIMARMSFNPEEWMGMTEMTEREIQIQCLRFARRHRARYGNSRLDLVDWKKALLRVSKNREGRHELERMFVAERNRQAQQQQNAFERMAGARPHPDQNPMKLGG